MCRYNKSELNQTMCKDFTCPDYKKCKSETSKTETSKPVDEDYLPYNPGWYMDDNDFYEY